jgi:hypothetical protein
MPGIGSFIQTINKKQFDASHSIGPSIATDSGIAASGAEMNATPHPQPSLLCHGILHYLQEHPEAADSLEGIASWWLSPTTYSVTAEAVQEALAQLVAEHRIARIDLADGRTLYQSIDKVSGSHPTWTPPTPRRRP